MWQPVIFINFFRLLVASIHWHCNEIKDSSNIIYYFPKKIQLPGRVHDDTRSTVVCVSAMYPNKQHSLFLQEVSRIRENSILHQ